MHWLYWILVSVSTNVLTFLRAHVGWCRLHDW